LIGFGQVTHADAQEANLRSGVFGEPGCQQGAGDAADGASVVRGGGDAFLPGDVVKSSCGSSL
jgi:hypothetical protein